MPRHQGCVLNSVYSGRHTGSHCESSRSDVAKTQVSKLKKPQEIGGNIRCQSENHGPWLFHGWFHFILPLEEDIPRCCIHWDVYAHTRQNSTEIAKKPQFPEAAIPIIKPHQSLKISQDFQAAGHPRSWSDYIIFVTGLVPVLACMCVHICEMY